MNEDKTYERIKEPDDPNRCQSTGSNGQCTLVAIAGGFCHLHGANKVIESNERKNIRNYKLSQLQSEFNHQMNNTQIKGLREEIALIRMMIQAYLTKASCENDLILYSGPISDLVTKLEKMVSSCHKLEGSMGQLLDKQAILQFASSVIAIIGEVINDEVKLHFVANKILALIPGEESTNV